MSVWEIVVCVTLVYLPHFCATNDDIPAGCGRFAKDTLGCGDSYIPRHEFPGNFVKLVIFNKNNSFEILDVNTVPQTSLLNLTSFSLADCNVREIRAGAFTSFVRLKTLNFTRNNIETIDPLVFQGLSSLDMLYLQQNPLHEISPNPFPLPRLRHLFLGIGKLTTLPENLFKELPQLTSLDLRSNRFTKLNWKVFTPVSKSLRIVDFDGNPWKCDCHIKFIMDYFQEEIIVGHENATCVTQGSNPEVTAWAEVNTESFFCAPEIRQLSLSSNGVTFNITNNALEIWSGNNSQLTCEYSGYPKPEVTWLKDGVPLEIHSTNGSCDSAVCVVAANGETTNDTRREGPYSSALILRPATAQDSGKYGCFTFTKFGHTERHLSLKVIGDGGGHRWVVIGLVIFALGVVAALVKMFTKRWSTIAEAQLVERRDNPMIPVSQPTFTRYLKGDLTILESTGNGHFGVVFKAQHKDGTVLAVKKICGERAAEFVQHEQEILSDISHPNIVLLKGLFEYEGSLSIVMEFVQLGDIGTILRETWMGRRGVPETSQADSGPSEVSQNNPPGIKYDELLDIARQIADGMNYLSSLKYVHRDLAARNCLLSSDRVVKIADFGLARDVYTKKYYRIHSSTDLPTRWRSPESLLFDRFELKSDVWSYGILLWELYSSGQTPYYQIQSTTDVIEVIKEGKLPTPTPECPEIINKLMDDCGMLLGVDRPSFREICERFERDAEFGPE